MMNGKPGRSTGKPASAKAPRKPSTEEIWASIASNNQCPSSITVDNLKGLARSYGLNVSNQVSKARLFKTIKEYIKLKQPHSPIQVTPPPQEEAKTNPPDKNSDHLAGLSSKSPKSPQRENSGEHDPSSKHLPGKGVPSSTPTEPVTTNPLVDPSSKPPKLLPSHISQNNEETKSRALSLSDDNVKNEEKEQENTLEKETMSVDSQNSTQEEYDEVTVVKVERNQKTNRNCCVLFEDQKQWCAQGQGTLIHILHLKPPQVTLCGMRTAALLDEVNLSTLQEILDFDINIKTESTNKVEEAIAEMVLMCEHRDHLAAIDHLVEHIDELHDKSPYTSNWIIYYALATLHPQDLPQSVFENSMVTLDMSNNFHKWWLAAHQHFGKIIVRPSNVVYMEGQAAHPVVMPQYKKVEANLMDSLSTTTIKAGFAKGEEIPIKTLLQSIELGESAAPQVPEMKQNLIKILSGACNSDKLWLWLKLSKTPPNISQIGQRTISLKRSSRHCGVLLLRYWDTNGRRSQFNMWPLAHRQS